MTIDENQSTEYPNSNVLRSQRLEIMRSCFEQVSALIRNSPAVEYDEYGNKIKVPDSTRLQLYGYYKCAIAVDEGDLPVASKRPSFFDPVGRAKFDAWVECRKECKENMGLAMEKYVEIAAALNHTLVGRKCEEIYQNAMENIRKLAQTSQDSSFGVVKKTTGRDHATEKAFIEKNEPIESDDVSLTREEEKNDINNKQMGHKTDDKSDSEAHFRHKWKYLPYWVSSFLPPPLIPRGQLDLSFADFFFALFHCTLDALYRTFFGGGLVHRFFTYILPSFAMALINIVVASFHPLQRIEKYEKLIAQRWMEMENGSSSYFQNNGEVIVGLSVRSLFDLYLSAQSYPSGSEIVIVPPVTIPGMIDIVKHHGLELVPVDIPSIENDAQRSSNEGPTNPTGEDSEDNMTKDGKTIRGHSFEDCNAARWGIDVESVKAAVTQRTVAIFVVHPFGTVIANHATMKALRTVANDHALELWEDCAQCYTGQSTTSKYKNPSKDNSSESSFPTIGYMGSSLSNACFFSFGPIKTATALGGGLAILRSAQSEDTICNTALKTKSKTEIADKMRRIQNALLSQQSNYSYCIRILKCFAVHLVSHSRLVCGAMKSFLGKIGINYDEFVIASLRGFASASRLGEKPSISYVRRRPCPALLAMIHRRLCDSANTEKKSRERLRRYGMLRKQISDNLIKQNLDADRVIFPKRIDGSSMHGWIFPILVQSPSKTSKLLLKLGYDAPCGMTQLKPVTNSESRVSATFKKILYLPLPSQNFSAEDENNLTAALDYVISKTYCEETSTSDNIRNERTRQVTKKRKSVQQYHFAYLLLIGLVHLEWVFSVFGLFHSKLLKIAYCCILQTARMLLLSTGICLAITLLLCQYMGPVYLKSSNTFAKYCDMVFESPFCDAGIEVEEHDAEGQQKKIFTQSKSALNLDFTSVPQRNTRVPDSSPSLHECSGDLQKALLTGVTGFVGSLLMRELLLHRHSLMIPGGVVVIVRSKRGKSAQERIDQLLSHSMFDFLTNLQKASLVQVVEGDVTLSDCGMQDADAKSIRTLNISHVFHCAAAVSFTQTMEDAAVSNITSSLQMRSLTRKLSNKNAKFVYISTAFVHGRETGTKTEPLPETLFSLHPYDPLELYKSMLGTQSYASAAMNALGFPNTYTFSKCICEHLLHGENDQNTLIIRPSIVGPSVQEPFEGWAGEKPSTIVAAACLYLKFPYNMWSFGKETVPFVPVDVLCRAIIARAFICLDPDVSGIDGAFSDSSADYENEEKKESLQFDHSLANYPRKYIVTVAWDASSHESASFSWLSYAYAITHMGSLCGHVHRVVAYSGLLLSTKLFPRLKFSLDAFDLLHSLLIRTPIDALLRLCDKLPWKPEFAQELKMLGQVLDLPLVFFPFANQSFYFRSELSPPGDFNSERYMFSCVVAAHRFIRRIEAKRRKHLKYYNSLNFREYPNYVCNSVKADRNISSIVVAGAEHTMPFSDFWWALTQPQGSIFIRFLGWILAKVFRHTVTEVEIDVASFVEYARTLSTLSKSDRPNVIIAPTHRSLYDFLIVSYICFSLPELGLEMPHIAAASEFSRIPIIGWIASKAGAFFVKRGEAKKDPNLSKTLSLITQSPTFIEVFIEGKRSRHRTFLAPKTGFLRCLAESNCNYIVLPMTINYEELPDQTSLVNEANGNRGSEMSLSALMNWSIQAFSGRINVGRIFISVSKAINGLNMNSKDPQYLGCCIQNHQQRRIVISEFHVRAASQAINIPPKLISNALSSIGCCHWPEWRDKGQFNQMPTDLAVQWSNLLHFGHALAPYLPSTHSQWALWLSPSNLLFGTKVQSNEIVDSIVSKIVLYFDAAEKAANDVINMLKEKGFSKPNENHVMQQLPNDGKVPLFLMKVAVKILLHGTKYTTLTKNTMRVTGHEEKVSCVEPLFHLDVRRLREQKTQVEPIESFGAWGYSDSYFVLNFRRDGTKFVSMKGRRYSICGKEIPGLVNFIEQELQVDITPNSLTLPPVPELNGVPDSDLTSEEFSQIAFTVNNDHNRLSTNTVDRARHGTGHTLHDMFNLRSGSIKIRLPDVVVWPKNEEELSSIISIATQRNWCVIPFGGGTNVTHANHCPEKLTDTRRMISVDMKLMNQILWVNEEDGLAHVEAGITGLHLIEQMNKRGFTIGHEPDSYEFSTLGGWIATKASGMKQNKYGNIEDIVKEVRVVGAKFNLSQKHKLNKVSFGRVSNGVDLKSLMLGSEGCLGIITSAVIKIWPIAETKQFESVLLPNFDAGLKFVKELSKMRTMKPASARLLDNDQFRLGQALKEAPTKLESLRQVASKSLGQYFGNFDGKSVVCATITFEGSCSEVKLQRKNVQMLAVNHGGLLAGPKVGKAGYDLTFAIAYLRDFAMNYSILGESFETFVPWSKLTQVVMATKKRIYEEHKNRSLPGKPFVCSRITQLYDEGACVYFYFCMNSDGVLEPSNVYAEIESCARQEILNNGGSLSHHHGLGKLRSQFVSQIFNDGYVNSIIAIKKAMDPMNTFGARNGVFSNIPINSSTGMEHQRKRHLDK